MTGIAKRLDRAVSTISGECARSPGKYRAHEAGKDGVIRKTTGNPSGFCLPFLPYWPRNQ